MSLKKGKKAAWRRLSPTGWLNQQPLEPTDRPFILTIEQFVGRPCPSSLQKVKAPSGNDTLSIVKHSKQWKKKLRNGTIFSVHDHVHMQTYADVRFSMIIFSLYCIAICYCLPVPSKGDLVVFSSQMQTGENPMIIPWLLDKTFATQCHAMPYVAWGIYTCVRVGARSVALLCLEWWGSVLQRLIKINHVNHVPSYLSCLQSGCQTHYHSGVPASYPDTITFLNSDGEPEAGCLQSGAPVVLSILTNFLPCFELNLITHWNWLIVHNNLDSLINWIIELIFYSPVQS